MGPPNTEQAADMTTAELSVAEVATELGITHQQVLNRLNRGKISGRKIGWIWLIPQTEVSRLKSLPKRGTEE